MHSFRASRLPLRRALEESCAGNAEHECAAEKQQRFAACKTLHALLDLVDVRVAHPARYFVDLVSRLLDVRRDRIVAKLLARLAKRVRDVDQLIGRLLAAI